MLCFARLIRCAIVASGTRNALAISAVVKPPTARRVRAIAEDEVRAGWQHMNNKISVSSGSMSDSISTVGTTMSASLPTAVSLSRRAISLRTWSVIRRVATWINQPRGLAGMPPCGHCVKAAIIASCTASSAEEKSRKRRATAPSTCGASSRKRCSEVASHGFVIALSLQHLRRRPAHNWAHFDRHVQGLPARTRRGRDFCRDVISPLRRVDIDNPVPGEKFLALRKYAVCDGQAILTGPHPLSLIGKRQTFGRDQLAGLAKLFVETDHKCDVCLEIFLRPLENPVARSHRIHHDDVFHFYSSPMISAGAAFRAFVRSLERELHSHRSVLRT